MAPTDAPTTKKRKRAPSAYARHVKAHYHRPECLKLPLRERLRHIARLWYRGKGLPVPPRLTIPLSEVRAARLRRRAVAGPRAKREIKPARHLTEHRVTEMYYHQPIPCGPGQGFEDLLLTRLQHAHQKGCWRLTDSKAGTVQRILLGVHAPRCHPKHAPLKPPHDQRRAVNMELWALLRFYLAHHGVVYGRDYTTVWVACWDSASRGVRHTDDGNAPGSYNYLTTFGDYQGGSIRIGAETFDPHAPHVLRFDARNEHHVLPVTSGKRYSVATYFCGSRPG